MKKILTILFFLISVFVSAQTSTILENKVDSLKLQIENAKHDSIIINIWREWDYLVYLTDPAMDFILNRKIDSLSTINLKKKINKDEKKFFLQAQAFGKNGMGIIHMTKGEYPSAIEFFKATLIIRKKLEDKKGIANAYNNIGNVFYDWGLYAQSLNYHYDALRMREEINDSAGIAFSLNNIGNVLKSLEKYDEALEKLQKALAIKKGIGDKKGLASAFHNLANLYNLQKKYNEALIMYDTAIHLYREVGDLRGVSSDLSGIGNIYHDLRKFDEALKYQFEALEIRETLNDMVGVSSSQLNIGMVYFAKGNASESKKWMQKGLNTALAIQHKNNIKFGYCGLSDAQLALGEYKLAIDNYKLFIIYRDSLINEETERKSLHASMQYEFDKKQTVIDASQDKRDALAKVEQNKKDELNREESKRQQWVIIFICFVLIIVIVFAVFVFRNLKLSKKQNKIIEEQKEIVEEKHKEITDSINYAERIQRSFLATKEILDQNLNEYFVFFQPKDIVSGDFYFASTSNEGNFFLACADSTGHGVPGAIMSILNIASLERAIDLESDPALILNETRNLIIDRLKKDGSAEGGKDGMDVVLLSFDFKNNNLEFALANNPLWMVRNGELIVFSPDKMPVGKHDKQNISFVSQKMSMQKGDLIFIFTDGFADQFGGANGKKFKYSNLQKILLENSHSNLEVIKSNLETIFKEWKGDLEQVDDVCIIGIRF